MVLEATMMVVDNSESSRNGDYVPSRWEAQSDAVREIFRHKTNANPESSVGLMSMGGKGPEVLVTLTTDEGKILDGIHRTKIRGQTHLATGIQIAGLALKHRQNKSQAQRIILFTCSPIPDDSKTLTKLAKKMKKNAISIDIVAFGNLDPSDQEKLKLFQENVNSRDGSHLAVVPVGDVLLSEHLRRTPILQSEGAAGAEGGDAGEGGDVGGGGGPGFEFGVDPSTDPELALALRMSMEEERARQERETRTAQGGERPGLGAIPEEASETQPLLEPNPDHHPERTEERTEGDDKRDEGGDGDKMETE